MRKRSGSAVGLAIAAALLLAAPGARAGDAECENGNFDSTFALIQAAIFERHGCTSALCHGASPGSGGLDLRAEAAYDELIDADAETPPVPGWKRVLVGQSDASLLYVNLAAKTLPGQWRAPLRAMPLDPEPALSTDELEAVRRWIEKGAPREGVIPGTGELLDACLPPPVPQPIKPLPPPAAGTGVQIRMPRWELEAQREREVCFASYYDVTDQVQPQFRGPDGTTFRYKFHQTRQDPLSHHMVPVLYEGDSSPADASWGEFRCSGGARDGELCDRFTPGDCGADGECSTAPVNSVACIGFGPGDGGIGLSDAGISITQQTAEEFRYAPGVYGELPLKGMILWSSHAFNLTDAPGKLEAWLNFEFAAPEEQLIPKVTLFAAAGVFKTNAPAFGTDEPCDVFTFPPGARVFELSSHMHKRGKRWRTFLGAYRCQSGPATGAPCSPVGYDFASPDVCGGAPCTSMVRERVADCNRDNAVTIDEITQGLNIALERAAVTACTEADGNFDGAVTVEEIVASVAAALNGVPPPALRDPRESLLYVSLIYNDPIVLRLDEELVFSSPVDDERAVTYCALYDNGFTDASEVKTRAGSPPPPTTLPFGGPCRQPTHCTAGKLAEPCTGANEAARNASCDSSDGTGDGFCDACTLKGGVTTEDEMFILLGQYYVP